MINIEYASEKLELLQKTLNLENREREHVTFRNDQILKQREEEMKTRMKATKTRNETPPHIIAKEDAHRPRLVKEMNDSVMDQSAMKPIVKVLSNMQGSINVGWILKLKKKKMLCRNL